MTIFMALLSLATLNCLTLSKDARIIELENALDKIKYDIVGLSEVRRKSAGEMDLSWSNGRLYHSARLPNHTAGVGFIIYAPASIDMLDYSTFIHEVEQAFHQPVTDINLYWTYDRDTFVWHMTDTPWTEFYVQYFELYWSSGELGLIVVLDMITFSHIIFKKSKISDTVAHMNRRAESRLILQSFCQCIPTTTVNIIFFFVFPGTKSPNLQIVCSAIWIVTNILDAFIIILFHFPQALAGSRKKNVTLVSSINVSSVAILEAH